MQLATVDDREGLKGTNDVRRRSVVRKRIEETHRGRED
jgi:hypothetical protein